MDYCQNCGRELKSGQKFCPECGAVQKEATNSRSVDDTPVQSRSQQSNKPMRPIFKSKGTKILTGIIVAVIIILFGTYKYIGSTLAPEKVAAQFADAVNTQNVKEMKEILNHNRPDLTIDEHSVSDFIAYFKKHPDVFSETVKTLNNDVRNLSVNKNYLNHKDPVSIVRDGKKWMLFDHYSINPKLYYLDVTANKKGTEILINGKSVGKVSETKRTFGPFLLCDFTIKGSYKGKYTTVQDTKTFNPIEEDSEHLTADLDLSGNSVTVYSNMENAILYVNGKSTGKKIADINTFGPVPVDGSLKMQAILKEGSKLKKSKEEAVTAADQEIDLEFPVSASSDLEGMMDSDYLGSSTEEIGQVVVDHYTDISDGDYEAAYNLMSPRRRAKTSLSSWSKGLKNNINNEVSISDVSQMDDTHAVVNFTLTSYDLKSNGDTLVQEWGGKWNLVYEDGKWLLDVPKISKLGSHTE